MLEESHFIPDKYHFMPEPTALALADPTPL